MSSITKAEPPRELATEPDTLSPEDNDLHPLVNQQTAKDTWLLLLFFRCINAALVWTFFQPDEYFQSLEPAWQMAFGPESGAWITWEWHHQLRSSLHPALFAVIYYVVNKPMEYVGFFPQFRAMILSILPNLVQAYLAATADYYTWQLSERIYGTGSSTAWSALLMTMASPWQWFCSTRTFSNGLETTLTIAALYFWPWKLSSDTPIGTGSGLGQEKMPNAAKPTESRVFETTRSVKHLRVSLFLAATACILRPTNGLIWFSILMPTCTRLLTDPKATISDYIILVREAIFCGAGVLAVSAASDLYYFGEWTFPPYQWLHFNINQDLAVFYGRNDWHYYLSQGLPLLLTTYLPFAIVAIFQATSLPTSDIRFLLTTTIFTTLSTLSLISHKEVRFIYPLLPLLHVLTAPIINAFFHTSSTQTTFPPPFPSTPIVTKITILHRKKLLTLLFALNLGIAGYTTTIHQAGVISVMKFLRNGYEALALDGRGRLMSHPDAGKDDHMKKYTNYDDSETFVGFLMPCHSTPWRSQLIYPGLKGWALSCEPPIHLAPHSKERDEYRDEADRFYDDPMKFLREEVNTKDRPWPRYIVGFEGIEGVLKEWYEGEMKGFRVQERWRTKNSQWHDDSRRVGDVVVWEFVDGSGTASS